MLRWRFPTNDFGETKGINDSGVTMFRGTPLKSLAREICQNSLDAGTEKTVMLEFNMFSIPTAELPGSEDLRNAFERCIEFWSIQKAKTTRDFFKKSLETINKEYCNILRISDFNTTGLLGSKEELSTDWTNLTKSSGSSDKKGTAGGSFGIGKFAPFACSDLSTVYYSTYDNEKVEAFQGVSRLVTFKREDNQTTQGIGYYGNEKNTPAYSQLILDKKFVRSEMDFGTDIYIAGYKYASEEWEKDIIISILDGFLGAIWRANLAVKVGNIEISHDTVEDLIEIYRDELTGYTDKYYEVLTSDKSEWIEEDLMGLGKVKLGILLGDQDAPRRIAMIRKTGMKIMDRSRLPGHIPLVGVMFIEGNKINQRLRSIENPEHTRWEPERSANPVREKELLKILNDFIRDTINTLVYSGNQSEIDATGVGVYLPIDIDDKGSESKEEVISEKVVEIEKTERIPIISTGEELNEQMAQEIKPMGLGEEDSSGDGIDWFRFGDMQNNKGEKERQNVAFDEGNKKAPKFKNVGLFAFTPICLNKDKGEYVFMLESNEDADMGILEVFLSAETQKYNAPIKKATLINGKHLDINENRIEGLNLRKNVQLRLRVELDYYDYCSLEVNVYAIKE
jgi:hypothetical protein